MASFSKIDEQLQKMREGAEEREAQRRATKANLPYLDLNTAPVQVDALKLIAKERAEVLQVATFEYKHPHLAIGVLQPDLPEVKVLLEEFEKKNFKVKVFVGSLRGLQRMWKYYQFVYDEAISITSRVDIKKDRIEQLTKELSTLERVHQAVSTFNFKDLPVVDFFELFLSGALANRTSDIHFEPEEEGVKLRFRIDGLLRDVTTGLDKDFYHTVLSRLKLLSNLKLNVQDRPQDGRFTIGFGRKEIEIRVAIAPSEFGEIIVMRILDPDAINLTLAQLGIRADDFEIIQGELKKPNGMILNTGPTGSGKTTTLYAFLKSKVDPETKIITIEDPIEYHVAGLEQTQVNEEAGYTFGNGLRSLMRQDPDIILVGEVRDQDTAEIALQAALTGHLVFSTVHANDAAGAIPRLLDLGVKQSSIGPALNLIIGQRLVRRLCQSCKVPQVLPAEMKKKIQSFLEKLPKRVQKSDYDNITMFEPHEKGCPTCNGFGYKGRIGIYELFVVGPEIEQMILKQTGEVEIQRYALDQGMVTMQQDGILKTLTGFTTFSEIESVTGPLSF
jgi:type IV pilus assembly protein PilB